MAQVIKKTIYLIFIFFIGLFIGSSFFIRAEYNNSLYGDKPILQNQKLDVFILLIVILILLSVVLYKMCFRLNKYSKKVVIPLVLLFSFAIQIIIIFTFTRLPTDDSQIVLKLAYNMLYNNDYSTFQKGGYLYMFPFNFSIVLYLRTLLAIFPNNYLVIKIFNILFSLLTTLMIYLIYKEVNYKSKENDYGVLVFAAFYFPSLFMCNLIYNDIIATAFLTSSIYFMIKFVKERSVKYVIFSAILLSIGNYFRGVGAVILIATCIYILFNVRRIGVKKVIMSLGIIGILFIIPSWAQNVLLQRSGIVDESINKNSAPVYMWLNMGINEEKFGFWDSMQSYNIYQKKAKYNKEKSTELFKKKIQQKLSMMTIGDVAEMYYKKIIWTWTEGTYQVERYGIGSGVAASDNDEDEEGGYSYSTTITDSFNDYPKYRNKLNFILYVINFLMYCCILIRLISGVKFKKYNEVFLILVVLGFIGFYILWEIKSRYIYPVYPLLIVLSYMGYKDIHDYVLKKCTSKFASSSRSYKIMKKIVYSVLTVMLLCINAISLVSCEAITAQDIHIIDSSQSANSKAWEDNIVKPDAIGRIVSVSVNSIKVELIEQIKNDTVSDLDDEIEDITDSDINSIKLQSKALEDMFESNYTGEIKNLAVSEDVKILHEVSLSLQSKSSPSKSDMEVIDLKKGQMVMLGYKEGTEIVERISVI